MATLRSVATFRDLKGWLARVTWYSNAEDATSAYASAQELAFAIASLSSCALQSLHGPAEQGVQLPIYGSNNQYTSVEDKLVVTFVTNSGALSRFEIPGPLAGLFLADGVTLDQSQTDWNLAIIHFLDGITCNRQGFTFNRFVGGVRVRRKNQRRLTMNVLDATLTNPAM